MQINTPFMKAILVLLPMVSFSQTTFIRSGGKEQWLLDRMEIKLQTNNDFNLSTVKPYLRNVYVHQGEMMDSMIAKGENPGNLSKIDAYNLDRFLANNSEFATRQKESWKSEHPWGKSFYQTKGNFIEVKDKDFYLSLNPAILQQQTAGDGSNGRLFINSKGVTARGMIGKVGFDFYATDNQERGPLYEQAIVANTHAVPGNGFFQSFKKTGQDYFDARGSVNWNITKYINMQFGYDKNFIGDGYRSLFLSDYSSNYLFLKFNTRIWKINYTNLFMELTNSFQNNPGNFNLPHKYASMHHFSLNATPWLNIGAFEAIYFGRTEHYEFSYLLPVIFLRSMESENGSGDNANLGFNFKANIAKKFQVYGQLMLDEFNLKLFRDDPTNADNKQAYQLGGKYVDAFGISNLDLQLEYNSIRPFTYSHYDSVSSVTNYNQPMAHPLGANLNEVVAIARYQPLKKLYLTGKIIHYMQGLDSAGKSFGSNPLRTYIANTGDYAIGSGNKAKCTNLSFTASYEVKENLFIEASGIIRTYKTASPITNLAMNNTNSLNTNIFSIGIRWNMARREYDY